MVNCQVLKGIDVSGIRDQRGSLTKTLQTSTLATEARAPWHDGGKVVMREMEWNVMGLGLWTEEPIKVVPKLAGMAKWQPVQRDRLVIWYTEDSREATRAIKQRTATT